MTMNNLTSEVDYLPLEKQSNQVLDFLKVINRFNVKYTLPVIVLTGIIVNLLALAVFIFSPLRRLTISVYLAALALTDIIFLLFMGIGWLETMGVNIFRLNGLCQTMVYLTFVVSFLSLWFIVIFTSELYFSIYCSSLHRIISQPRRAIAITLVLTALACFIYMFSFWMTQNVEQSDTKISCGFIGSRSAAIAVPIMDSVLTLVVPFGLLIFMYVRIVYTLASLSHPKFKNEAQELRHEPEVPTPSDNLLAKAIRMGTRIRQSLNRSPRIGITPKKSSSPESESTNSHCVRLDRVKKISLNFSDGELTIYNSEGGLLSISNLVVMNEKVGISVSPRPINADGNDEEHACSSRRRFSCSEANVLIKAKAMARRVSDPRQRPCREKIEVNLNKGGMSAAIDKATARIGPRNIKVKEIVSGTCLETSQEEEEELKIEAEKTTSTLLDKSSKMNEEKKSKDDSVERDALKRLMSLQKLKTRCLNMIISIAVIFVVLNLPTHAIRLQSMLRSLFNPRYRTSELELHLQQFFQTVYYFNFIANFITYSAFAKSFRVAFINLPWHMVNTFSQLFRSLCFKNREQVSYWTKQRHMREINEHSRLVEICIPDLHLSQIPSFASDYKYVSPPCLLTLESSSKDNRLDKENSVPESSTVQT